MRPMRLHRPKSLSGLMLIGFTIVAAPLLFAIVNAAVQMNRLSIRSQQLVVHGMQGTAASFALDHRYSRAPHAAIG